MNEFGRSVCVCVALGHWPRGSLSEPGKLAETYSLRAWPGKTGGHPRPQSLQKMAFPCVCRLPVPCVLLSFTSTTWHLPVTIATIIPVGLPLISFFTFILAFVVRIRIRHPLHISSMIAS